MVKAIDALSLGPFALLGFAYWLGQRQERIVEAKLNDPVKPTSKSTGDAELDLIFGIKPPAKSVAKPSS